MAGEWLRALLILVVALSFVATVIVYCACVVGGQYDDCGNHYGSDEGTHTRTAGD